MNGFDIFRINCWLEDLEDYNYETSILVTAFEYILHKDNLEQPRKEIYEYITKKLGIKLQYNDFTKFLDSSDDVEISALEDDVLIKLKDSSIQKFRERFEKFNIDKHINDFATIKSLSEENKATIKDILLKSLYVNINSFVVTDLKTLISESIKSEFDQDDIDIFNQFLEWESPEKNKSIYSLFSKAIEFAILTSGRGISTISKDIFKNKTYYLDANVIIRALGVDGNERQESIISVLESCSHDGIKFKIGKCTSDELYGIVNKRSRDIKKKTNSDSEEFISTIIDDLPFNNSFETDYLKKRKSGKVSSPNNYRLSIEQELEKFVDKFALKVEVIKNIPAQQITQLTNKLYDSKQNDYNRKYYSKGAALVDAKNILHVRNIRDHNNYNYKDIKSFYLTTDGTLNEIIGNENPDAVSETILPSQLFVIHNSFHKTTTEQDYKDFIKFIKIRKTDFKLPGTEIFNYIEQIRTVTSDPKDISSTLRAYANYKFQHRDKYKEKEDKIIPIKEFTTSLLEKELNSSREIKTIYSNAQKEGLAKLPKLFKLSTRISYFFEILILIIAAILVYLLNISTNTFLYVIGGVVLFRIILFALKDKFGFHRNIRNYIFVYLSKRTDFIKVHKKDKEYAKTVEEMKNTT